MWFFFLARVCVCNCFPFLTFCVDTICFETQAQREHREPKERQAKLGQQGQEACRAPQAHLPVLVWLLLPVVVWLASFGALMALFLALLRVHMGL